MPIRDRSRRRLVRLGVIRLGHKETRKRRNGTEYSYPVQDDHFVLTDAPQIEKFYHARGIDKVRELDVLTPFPDVERNFDANYQVWAGGVLVCQGDGEYVAYATPSRVTVNDKGTHVYNAPGDTLVSNGIAQVDIAWNGETFQAGDPVPCPGAAKDAYPHCAACKLNGLLKVMMADPELFEFGYYQISTGSLRNYDTIMCSLELVPAGQLNGYPFQLRLVEEGTTYQGDDGKRHKGTKWFLHLVPDRDTTRELYKRHIERMIRAPAPRPAIAATNGPDWDAYEAEPAAPPPYAEEQIQVGVVVDADDVQATPEVIDFPAQPTQSAPPAQPANTNGAHQWTIAEADELFTWTRNDLVITDADTLQALGVKKLSAYEGTPNAARAAINAYVSTKAAPVS